MTSHLMLLRFTHQNCSSAVLGFSHGMQSSVSMLPSPLLSTWQGLRIGSAAQAACRVKMKATTKVAVTKNLNGRLRFLIEL